MDSLRPCLISSTPPHPGLTLRDDVLLAPGLSVTEAAQQLDVSRVARKRPTETRLGGLCR